MLIRSVHRNQFWLLKNRSPICGTTESQERTRAAPAIRFNLIFLLNFRGFSLPTSLAWSLPIGVNALIRFGQDNNASGPIRVLCLCFQNFMES